MGLSLRGRIALVLVGSLLLALLATFAATLATTRSIVLKHASGQLDIGSRVFQRLLDQRAQRLTTTAQVLAADFGFKEAVATGEADTVGLALLNHGARIGAAFAILVDDQGTRLAASAESEEDPGDIGALLENALTAGSAHGVVLVGGQPKQLVLVPVHVPIRIGWVALGFAIDDVLAKELRTLTGLHVTFFAGENVITTLDPALAAALPDPSSRAEAVALRRDLDLGLDGHRIRAVLLASESEALAPFRAIRRNLGIVAAVALLVALLAALLLARSLARPVGELAAVARRIGAGDYQVNIDSERSDELGLLARTLAGMREAIAERERRIEHQAFHDALTALPNRASAIAFLRSELDRRATGGAPLAVLLLDGNRFKEINDTLGHAVGDQVLIALGRRLAEQLPGSALLARLGGDEFLVVLQDLGADGALDVASRLGLAVAEPMQVADMDLHLDVSIGIALYPEHGAEPETLLRRADIAMYAAKEAREPVCIYAQGEDEQHLRRLRLINDLRSAIGGVGLELHFQPKLDLGDGRIHQVEALLRWTHPELGRIGPDEFVPLAEHSGLIHALTQRVLGEALGCCAQWRAQGLEVSVAVNVSALNLMDRSLPGMLKALLAQHGLPPERLILEITESAVMRDAARAIRVLERLRALGLRLSIDDFGTGHSSLSQLRRLPVHELKIDRSFVQAMGRSERDSAIVRSTIELAHGMGLKVTAEGVEDEDSQSLLWRFGCDQVQGYLIGRPMPAEALGELLRGAPDRQHAISRWMAAT
jgi:diguanylate cyclase (GGDEF)-like protein